MWLHTGVGFIPHTQISSYELGDDLFDMLIIEYTIIYEFPKI